MTDLDRAEQFAVWLRTYHPDLARYAQCERAFADAALAAWQALVDTAPPTTTNTPPDAPTEGAE